MRRLVVSMVVSLDGFVEGADGNPPVPEWSADLDDWTTEAERRFDLLIYGHVAWRQMAAFWPGAANVAGMPPGIAAFAGWMNSVRKCVFSSAPVALSDWSGSARADVSLPDLVARERTRPGQDMVIFAGVTMAQTALRAGLVDEIRLLTVPLVMGAGRRLFDGPLSGRSLALTDLRRMDTGAVLSQYRVA